MSLSTRTLTTQYLTETTTTEIIISPVLISSDVTITITYHLSSIITATFGQTLTIQTPSLSSSPPLSTTASIPASSFLSDITQSLDTAAKYTPSARTMTETATIVFTELDIYLQNTAGNIYSTWLIPCTPAPSAAKTSSAGWVYVVPATSDGWDNWDGGEKAGLIVGVVLGAGLLLAMLWFCFRNPWKNWWFASGWPTPPQQTTAFETPGPSFVQPTYANAPIMPYSYQPGGYGLRGGAAKKQGWRWFSERN
jgi:hypothetical protein